MKLLAAIALLASLATPAFGLTCPANVSGISPSATSCWNFDISSGTAVSDLIDSNPLTLNGGYTLNQNGGLACSNTTVGSSGNSGCNLNSALNLSNPQPFTMFVDFAGSGGGLAQLAPSNTNSLGTPPYLVLYLDNFGHLTFGVNNLNSGMVLQSPLTYADGNEHKAAVSLGAAGMKMYVDGVLVASRNVTLSQYISGYLFFGGINGTNWALSQPNQNFNGTLFAAAWWQGNQLSDQNGVSLTGGSPPPITNNYCTFTNQIASLNPAQAMAFANKTLTFALSPNQMQLPGGGSMLPIGPSTQTCTTDAAGNILPGCQIPQGAHVNLSVGFGNPIPLVIPFSTSCDLTAIMLSQTDPPEVVSAIATAGPALAGFTVTNPPAGQIGTATITAPAAASQTQALSATVNIGVNGNVQQVILAGSIPINLTNFASGANFEIDITENATGGYAPTFTVPGGWTLQWPGGGSQPGMPSTNPNAHNLWQFVAVSNSVLVGTVTSLSGASFPLSTTGNFNNYSGANVNSISFANLISPTPTVTATCTSTCGTTYTYGIACLGDNGTESLPVTGTAVNNASLSGSNYNTVAWSPVAGCASFDVYGRSGSQGLLATCPGGTGCTSSTSFQDTGADSPGASPPTFPTTSGVKGNMNVSGNINVGGALAVDGMGDFGTFYSAGAGTVQGLFTLDYGNAPQLKIAPGVTNNVGMEFDGTGSAHTYSLLVDYNDTFKLYDDTAAANIFNVDQSDNAMDFPYGLEMTLGGSLTTNGGTLPTVSCSGSGASATPTAHSTLTSGSITVGSSATAACTVTFHSGTCPNALNCTAGDSTTLQPLLVDPLSTASVEIESGSPVSALANDKVYWTCGCN